VGAGVEIKNKSAQREGVRKQVRSPIPVLFGFDQLETLKWMKAHNAPFLFIDHAYFDRGYERGNFRAIYNTIHQTNEYDLPDDRRKKFSARIKDWRDHPNGRIVFIPTPPNPASFHKDYKWNENAIDSLVSQTQREIYVKDKKTKGLGDSIKGAFCLVSHCSVAAVEAACEGIPVISPKESPAYPISGNLSQVETLVRPDRDKWLNTLTYSQFTLDELRDGSAWQIIKEMNRL
jgi:hypothetical protein